MPQTLHPRTSKAARGLDQIHVMVVDGSAKSGQLIRNVLMQLGFSNVLVASNAFQGLKLTREVNIDIIVTDWELLVCKHEQTAEGEQEKEAETTPVDGSLFVKRLRFSPASPYPFVPVIMLLKSASPNEILNARDSGVDEIVVKPFNADDFCKKITNIIESPRNFITSKNYKGPCRRRNNQPLESGKMERRKKEIRLIGHDEGAIAKGRVILHAGELK